jgi:hypothetical protein
MIDLLKKKEAGEKIEPAKEGPAPQVVNLHGCPARQEALQASMKYLRPRTDFYTESIRGGASSFGNFTYAKRHYL